jgi:hypothetical protein
VPCPEPAAPTEKSRKAKPRFVFALASKEITILEVVILSHSISLGWKVIPPTVLVT